MSDTTKRLVAGCLACALALALLAWAAFHAEAVRHLDTRVLAHASAGRFGPLGNLAGPVADLGNPLPQALVLGAGLGVALNAGRPEAALAGVVLVAGADLTTLLLKHALAAPRHDALLGWYQVGEDSFPSGHATAAFATAAAWLVFVPPGWRKSTAVVAGIAACAVAAAVVVLRHHFPSDALGGLLVAAAWTCAVCAVLQMCTSAQEIPSGRATFRA